MADDRQGEPSGQSPSLSTLADRLEYLFDQIRPLPEELGESEEHGRPYTNREIVAKINAAAGQTGVTISPAYLSELRRGVASDPRMSHIRALARAFGVDPTYFFGDDHAASAIREQIQLLKDLRGADVKQVALRRILADTGLSEASTHVVQLMVERLRDVDRHSDDPDPGADHG